MYLCNYKGKDNENKRLKEIKPPYLILFNKIKEVGLAIILKYSFLYLCLDKD